MSFALKLSSQNITAVLDHFQDDYISFISRSWKQWKT